MTYPESIIPSFGQLARASYLDWAMKHVLLLVAISLVAIAFSNRVLARDASGPRFEDDAMPEPPRQKEAWTPPAATPKLSEKLCSACQTLFEQGLADPRGCEYRVIKIGVGSVWGGYSVVTTHGWVLPAGADGRQRFAIVWNGLVYAVASVGDAADFKADILETLKIDEEARGRFARDHAGDKHAIGFHRYPHAQAEEASTSAHSLFPLRACLLLRLGETDLAGQWWEAWMAGMPANVNNNRAIHQDPYLLLAGDWLWSRFDRLICAHMRGDDQLALLDARMLAAVAGGIDAAAEKRGVKPPQQFARDGQAKLPSVHLTFLYQLPALLADQERRAKERAAAKAQGPTTDKAVAVKAATPAEQAAALVLRLDEVSARQWGQPGGVSLGEDEIVQQLVAVGDDAIEPLLQCLENDTRLTRSVHFHRDFFQSRSVIGVHEAAYVALAQILHASFFGPASTGDDLTARGLEGRRAVAARIREHWTKFKGVSLEERWYRTLSDDSAPPEQWAEAAANIIQPADVEIGRGSMFGTNWVIQPAGSAPSPRKLRGEALRAGKEPAVSQLLRKRLETLEAGSNLQTLRIGASIAKALAAWEGKAALKDMRLFTQFLQEQIRQGAYGQTGWVVREVAEIYQTRAASGDDHALDEYADWVQTVTPLVSAYSTMELFQLMWRNPTHPAIAAAAETMFNDPKSSWNPLLSERRGGADINGLLESPLLGVDGFRKQVLRMLEDKNSGGETHAKEDGRVDYTITNGWGSGTTAPKGDPRSPVPGTKQAFRVCDAYAFAVSGFGGLPECELYWPEADRDAAVKRCAEILQQYGACFRCGAGGTAGLAVFERAAFTLGPPLNHPATPEDVKAGRAIFSLAESVRGLSDAERQGAPTRLCPLSARPMKATWAALKTHARDVPEQDPATRQRVVRRIYDQAGQVWQAEEIQIAGQWRRFYGFVGRYDVACVPAAEMEFPGSDSRRWKGLSNGIDCCLNPPGVKHDDAAGTVNFTLLGIDGPVKAVLSLRNRRAVPTELPSTWYDPSTPSGPALRPGVELKLAYSSKPPDPELSVRPELLPDAEWEQVPPRPRGRWTANQSRRVLQPGESFDACELDLAGLFQLTKPGTYRLQIELHEKENGAADGTTTTVTFQLAASAKKP